MRSPDLWLIYGVALLRSLGIGLIGVLAGIYLFRVGFTSTQIGLVIGAGLAGAAAGLFVVSMYGDRLGRRRTLLLLSLLGGLGGLGLAATSSPVLVVLIAALSMLNAMGTDRTAAFALEQAVIPALVPEERRTWALSLYNLVLDVGHALGALGAALPLLFQRELGIDLIGSYRLVFLIYGALNVVSAVLYRLMSPAIETARPSTIGHRVLLPASKRIIRKLAALSAVDSFGGGFLTDALIAYWFFRRFGASEPDLGLLFFAAHTLNAGSYLAAAWLARRIGLVKTMVFTHLPSSLFLLAIPFAPSFGLAALLFLAREALVEMDVPTRQSYIVAVVRPEERTFASGVTNLTRNVSWAAASSVAGALMQGLGFSAPLLLGGGLKITYDLLLYRAFRHIRPPEEAARTPSSPGGTAIQSTSSTISKET
ncbi:MAG TPA: MFS transporter [Terriglobales bacterium]|nr:MFS transporter [Terriglobales bacterium]